MKLTLTQIWNDSISTEDKPLAKRDYLWASELGKPDVDVYLAMNATPPTNPPNMRSRRKFYAGHVWEFIVGVVLNSIGIIQEGQEEVWTKDGALWVKGKLDYKIGGKPDYEKGRKFIKSLPFDPAIEVRFLNTINLIESKFGNTEIDTMIYEIKSCSEYVYNKISEGGNISGHDLQIFHYLKGLNINSGMIAYVSKNDSLMAEREILNNQDTYMPYSEKLLRIKKYIDLAEMPPREPLIVYEDKFQKNFGIEYSNYLTMLYGYDRPDQYSEVISGQVASWNRVLSRIIDIETGKTTPTGKAIQLTDKNKIAIEEMHKWGYDAYALAKDKIAKGKIDDLAIDDEIK